MRILRDQFSLGGLPGDCSCCRGSECNGLVPGGDLTLTLFGLYQHCDTGTWEAGPYEDYQYTATLAYYAPADAGSGPLWVTDCLTDGPFAVTGWAPGAAIKFAVICWPSGSPSPSNPVGITMYQWQGPPYDTGCPESPSTGGGGSALEGSPMPIPGITSASVDPFQITFGNIANPGVSNSFWAVYLQCLENAPGAPLVQDGYYIHAMQITDGSARGASAAPPGASAAAAASYPGLLGQAANLAGSLRGWAASGLRMAPIGTVEMRRATCKSCEHWDARPRRCRICGCYTEARIRLASEHCPLPEPKW